MFWSSGKRQHSSPVYREQTHTGQYFNFYSNHPLHVKTGLIQRHHKRASAICEEWQDLFNEISSLRYDRQINGYPQGFTDLITGSMGSSHKSKEEKPLGCVYPMCGGCFREFKHIGNWCSIRMIFSTKNTLRISLVKTRLERDWPTDGTVCL
jgi:hypothetical protein